MEIEFKIYTTNKDYYLMSLLLRYKILRAPLALSFNQSDFDRDKLDVHIAGFLDGKMVACLILQKHTIDSVKIRQVAVDSTVQRMGIGKLLDEFAINYCRELGVKKIHCHARKTAVPFYLSQHYSIFGEVFLEVGIEHVYMEKMI